MKFTAIVPGAYPGDAKMCLRLIAEADARSVGDSQAILLVISLHQCCFILLFILDLSVLLLHFNKV